ncbi:MAG: Phosphoglycerate mutase [Ramlibacter sp.]|jgi:alpha-ribazole phosphatase|uniref:histidine phosphatase family protein n=1 Tax=Ramlibacter sp. TaxID=1917967 RepID=UPI002604CF8B|nr:histidine phosphatase family protein [Ramlibacter sp.]MDB5752690.1 Phosphoglycerate mutase [Ramlibacter sp.]
MKLWLVRHAQPLVDPGVCYGAMDVAADVGATQQAGTALAKELPAHVQVLCSPLQRCTQLANVLHALRPDLAWRVDPRLREMDFGCWEGWRWSNIAPDAFAQWTADFHAYRFGGHESVGELMDRVAQVLSEFSQLDQGVWITHAGVMRAATLLTKGVVRLEAPAQWPLATIPLGRAQCLSW